MTSHTLSDRVLDCAVVSTDCKHFPDVTVVQINSGVGAVVAAVVTALTVVVEPLEQFLHRYYLRSMRSSIGSTVEPVILRLGNFWSVEWR